MRLALPVFALLAASAFAQEKPAPPPDTSIDAAKRDFNALKAARGSLDAPTKLDLPSVATPDFSGGPSQPLPSVSKADPALAKQKSANWLVDAMMKPEPKDSRDPRSKTFDPNRSKSSDLALNDRENRELTAAGTDLASKADSEKRTPPMAEKKTGPEFNPLTSYMAGWMTPQDYSLLKPGLDSAAASRTGGSPIDPVSTGGTNDFTALAEVGAGDFDFGTKAKFDGFALAKPADNPFLQSVNPPSTPAANFTAPGVVSPVNAASSALAPPPIDQPAPKSKIPDFAKPATDEKYFKQLKRF